jgi:hypothetical protein
MRTTEGKGTTRYYEWSIHEVYYDDKGKIDGWTEESVGPHGESLDDLRRDLALMRKALTLPVLGQDTGKEVKP